MMRNDVLASIKGKENNAKIVGGLDFGQYEEVRTHECGFESASTSLVFASPLYFKVPREPTPSELSTCTWKFKVGANSSVELRGLLHVEDLELDERFPYKDRLRLTVDGVTKREWTGPTRTKGESVEVPLGRDVSVVEIQHKITSLRPLKVFLASWKVGGGDGADDGLEKEERESVCQSRFAMSCPESSDINKKLETIVEAVDHNVILDHFLHEKLARQETSAPFNASNVIGRLLSSNMRENFPKQSTQYEIRDIFLAVVAVLKWKPTAGYNKTVDFIQKLDAFKLKQMLIMINTRRYDQKNQRALFSGLEFLLRKVIPKSDGEIYHQPDIVDLVGLVKKITQTSESPGSSALIQAIELLAIEQNLINDVKHRRSWLSATIPIMCTLDNTKRNKTDCETYYKTFTQLNLSSIYEKVLDSYRPWFYSENDASTYRKQTIWTFIPFCKLAGVYVGVSGTKLKKNVCNLFKPTVQGDKMCFRFSHAEALRKHKIRVDQGLKYGLSFLLDYNQVMSYRTRYGDPDVAFETFSVHFDILDRAPHARSAEGKMFNYRITKTKKKSSPFEKVKVYQESMIYGSQHLVITQPVLLETTKDFDETAIDQRRCFVDGERELKYHEKYSRSACIEEFAAEKQIKMCKCIPWFLGNSEWARSLDLPVCEINGITCFSDVLGNATHMAWLEDTFEESDCLDHCSGTYIKIKSNTLPPVKALTHQDNLNQNAKELLDTWRDLMTPVKMFYKLRHNKTKHFDDILYEMSGPNAEKEINAIMAMLNPNLEAPGFLLKTKDLVYLDIYYDTPTFTKIVRGVKATMMDKISNIGGTLGLFAGVSLFSIIEFIYWFCISAPKVYLYR